MKPVRFLVLLFAVFCLSPVGAETTPNVLVIMVDDLGYADLGCQGSADIRTPNIDALAASGVRFAAGYVPASVCGPSRACFITGQYSVEFGINGNGASTSGIPHEQKTIAEHLKMSGRSYYTAAIGKWHLGHSDDQTPMARGFDHFLGFLGGSSDYFMFDAKAGKKEQVIQRNSDVLGLGDLPPETYLTDLFTDEAVSLLRGDHGRGNKPFFMYLAYNAPHGPLQAPEVYQQRNHHIADKKRRTFAAMMTGVDDGVGRVMTALEEEGLRETTLVVFLSDNGGPTRVNTSLNTPFRGFKGNTWEGGVRVPFMASWPGTIEGGRVIDEKIFSIDLAPTILKLAGCEVPLEIDGIDLLPWLTGAQETLPERDFYFWRGSARGLLFGTKKYTRNKGAGVEFFDLAENPQEDPEHQLIDPEVRTSLETRAQQWEASWPPAIDSEDDEPE